MVYNTNCLCKRFKKVTYWYEDNSFYVIYMDDHKERNYTYLFVDEKF